MSDTVIQVDSLGKMYRIGHAGKRPEGLRHALEATVKRWGRRLTGRGDPSPVYEDFWALKDVSFEVKRGDCIGVIGRNGAGKSTLLKVLSRITEPTEGEVRMRGRVGSLLEVGTGFHGDLSGRENIYLNGAILGMGRAEVARKFDEIVAFSEVEKFLDTPVKYYSSGMYMRLAFAVAAHLEPEILIVDEVLAVGDAQFQQKCLGKMNEVARGGRTVLFVSHNMQAVSTLCNTCVMLRQGRMYAAGRASEVVREYLAGGDAQPAISWAGVDGDEDLALLEVRACGTEAENVFQTDRPLRIQITFRNRKPILGLICAVDIFARSGMRLVYSCYDDRMAPPPTLVPAGTHVWNVTIPPDTFAAGDYRIEVDLGIHNVYRATTSASGLLVRIENLSGIGRRFVSTSDVFRPDWPWTEVAYTPEETAAKESLTCLN